MRRTNDVSLWSWPLTLDVTVIVGHTRLGTLSKYQVQILQYGPHGSDIPCDRVTLSFNLRGHGVCRWCGSTSSIRTPTLKLLGLTVRKIWHILCVCVSLHVTLTDLWLFDLETGAQCSTCYKYSPANFVDTTTIRFRFMGSDDHVTLRPWPLTLEVIAPVADAGRRPPFDHLTLKLVCQLHLRWGNFLPQSFICAVILSNY